jgi:hypothetical protein
MIGNIPGFADRGPKPHLSFRPSDTESTQEPPSEVLYSQDFCRFIQQGPPAHDSQALWFRSLPMFYPLGIESPTVFASFGMG